MAVTKAQAQKLIGKQIYAVRKDGRHVTGKLVRISGNRLVVERGSGKKVQVKALIPLVLFDLLAIGATSSPYYGGYPGGYNPYGGGYGFGGYNPYGYYYRGNGQKP